MKNILKTIFLTIPVLLSNQLQAQKVIKLDSTTFYQVSTTAFGKAIVYAQRNVQLKKAGNYQATTKEGNVSFTLNKNFYIDGDFASNDTKRGTSTVAKYSDGTEIYNLWDNGTTKFTRTVTVKKQGNDYLIVKTKLSRRDSTVEQYLNRKPLSKEKYTNKVLVIKNDRKTGETLIYGADGKLWEKHDKNGEEHYSYDGTVKFKKVYLKGRTEEYNYGKLTRLFEFQKDKTGQEIYTTTNFDKEGNVLNKTSDSTATGVPAPEYMIFELDAREFESYKAIADSKQHQ